MIPVQKAFTLCFSALLAYLYSFFASDLNYTPQLIALATIVEIIYITKNKNLNIPILIFTVTTLIFTTNGLSSPFFVFTDFLLFLIAFFYHPVVTITFSAFMVLLLSNSVNQNNLLNLVAILLITPYAWLIAKLHKKYQDNLHEMVTEQTDMEMWIHLEFKKRILKNLDLLSKLVQNKEVKTITENERYFLNSTRHLSKELSSETDKQSSHAQT